MSEQANTDRDGGPVFPETSGEPWTGMSLRDYMAGQALTGILAYSPTDSPNGDAHTNCTYYGVAEMAYGYADAMIAERKKEGGQ